MTLDEEALASLIAAARAASNNAYAPYSRFHVGAACITGSGRIFAAANVENASYGLSICAERAAIFQAVAAGERDIQALALFTPTAKPVTPCGACRQVICEFGAAIDVIACSEDGSTRTWTAADLLPDRFTLL